MLFLGGLAGSYVDGQRLANKDNWNDLFNSITADRAMQENQEFFAGAPGREANATVLSDVSVGTADQLYDSGGIQRLASSKVDAMIGTADAASMTGQYQSAYAGSMKPRIPELANTQAQTTSNQVNNRNFTTGVLTPQKQDIMAQRQGTTLNLMPIEVQNKTMSAQGLGQRLQYQLSNQPLQQQLVNGQLVNSIDMQPVQQQIANNAIYHTANQQPVRQGISNSQLAHTASQLPVQQGISNSQLVHTANQQPVRQGISNSQLQHTANQLPLQQSMSNSQLVHSATQQPVRQGISNSQLQHTASQLPLQQSMSNSQLVHSASQQPVQQGISNSQLAHTASQLPIQQGISNSQLVHSANLLPKQQYVQSVQANTAVQQAVPLANMSNSQVAQQAYLLPKQQYVAQVGAQAQVQSAPYNASTTVSQAQSNAQIAPLQGGINYALKQGEAGRVPYQNYQQFIQAKSQAEIASRQAQLKSMGVDAAIEEVPLATKDRADTRSDNVLIREANVMKRDETKKAVAMNKALIPLSRLSLSKPSLAGESAVAESEDAIKAGIIPSGSMIKYEDNIWKVKSLEGDIALTDVINVARGMFNTPNTKTVNMVYSGTGRGKGNSKGKSKSNGASSGTPTNSLLGTPSDSGGSSPTLEAVRSSIGAIDPSNAGIIAVLRGNVPESVWKDRYQFTSVDEYITYATGKYGK